VHLVFDICQGIGIAAAVGIRPFLPALVAGALAAGNVEIHFKGTDYSFLQNAPFLLGCALVGVLMLLIERRFRPATGEPRWFVGVLGAIGAALGAVFFAGSLARGHYASWPGLVGGVLCAAAALAATAPLLARVRARLDAGAAAAVPLYGEGAGILFAGLSIVAPPLGPIGLLALLWLLIAGRRRADQKYAGLRILR
jgi:hypothetical protein